jgi:presenilin-like A22 family membrane protease
MAEKDKKELLAVAIMGILFLIVYGLAILLIKPLLYAEAITPANPEINDPMFIVTIFVIMISITILILLIAKYWKDKVIQLIILFAVGYTAAYAFFYPIFSLILPFFSIYILSIFSFIPAIILVVALYKYPEWYVINISGIIIGIGAIMIFGISISILLVIIFLIILAVYDAISVYKTKHMIDLADTVMDLKLPVLLVVPKIRNYSLIKETKRLKEKLEQDEERDAFFMGLGDIVMPGILVTAVYTQIPEFEGLLVTLSVIIGIMIGFMVLMSFVLKGKPQAGLPCLCGGAILGYVISSLIIFKGLEGLVLPF